jgi:hypothetical protein
MIIVGLPHKSIAESKERVRGAWRARSPTSKAAAR